MTLPLCPSLDPAPWDAIASPQAPGSSLPGGAWVEPGGAWRPGLGQPCLHAEIFAPAGEGSGAGLALALARDALATAAEPDAAGEERVLRPWLWVQDRAALRLSGRPYLHGLPRGLGESLIHVAAPRAEDALFALEEGVRCRDLAFVIGEIAGNPRALDFTASRRLSLAAERHGVPLWLVRLDARRDLGSARLRWEARAAPSPRPRWNGQAPGIATWDAELFRAHRWQPGRWLLREEDGRLAAEAWDGGAGNGEAGNGARASILRQAQDGRGSARAGLAPDPSAPGLSLSQAAH